MKSSNVVARFGGLLLSPLVLIAVILVPALAAGVYHSTHPAPNGQVDAVNTGAVSAVGASGDPLAQTRSSLGATTLPLSLLNNGMAKLSDGGLELDDGAHQLSDGLHEARSGSAELADGMTQLQSGLWQIGGGSTQVSAGVDTVVGSLTGLAAIQGQIELIVQQSIDQLVTSQDPAAQGSIDQLRTVLDMLRTNGLGSDVLAQLQQLKDGASTLAYQTDDPASDFVSGMTRATEGSAALHDGLIKLDDGGNRLVDGTGQLVDGTTPMTNVLGGVQDNIAKASAALPPANRIVADPAADLSNPAPTAASTNYVIRPAFPEWPYLGGALALVASMLVVTLAAGRTKFPVAMTIATAVSSVAVVFVAVVFVAQDGLGAGGLAAAALVIGLWSAAFSAAGRAIVLIAGNRIGRLIVLAAGAAQVVIVGIAGSDVWFSGTHLASFTPLGQLTAALGETAVSGSGVRTVISGTVAGATIVVSLAVTSAHRGRHYSESAEVTETPHEPSTVSVT